MLKLSKLEKSVFAVFMDLVIAGSLVYLISVSDFSFLEKVASSILSIFVVGGVTFFLGKQKEGRVKQIGTAIVAIFLYFFLSETMSLPFALLDVNPSHLPVFLKTIYMIAYEVVMMAMILFLYIEPLNKAIIDMKQNHQDYFKKYFKYWFLILIIMFISNGMIAFVTEGGIASNEEAVRSIFSQSPAYMFFSAVIFAPIIEEIIFRFSFRNILTNKWLFIIVSGFIFGGLHVFPSMTSWVDLLYLIPYCTPGIIFAYLLTKTDNILVPIGLHFVHNGVLMALQMIVLIFG